MTEGEPKFTPTQQENLNRHSYLNHVADELEKEVDDNMNVAHLLKAEDPDNPVMITPSRELVTIFQRMAKSIYEDEIVTDKNPNVRSFADASDSIRKQEKAQRKRKDSGGLDIPPGSDH